MRVIGVKRRTVHGSKTDWNRRAALRQVMTVSAKLLAVLWPAPAKHVQDGLRFRVSSELLMETQVYRTKYPTTRHAPSASFTVVTVSTAAAFWPKLV